MRDITKECIDVIKRGRKAIEETVVNYKSQNNKQINGDGKPFGGWGATLHMSPETMARLKKAAYWHCTESLREYTDRILNEHLDALEKDLGCPIPEMLTGDSISKSSMRKLQLKKEPKPKKIKKELVPTKDSQVKSGYIDYKEASRILHVSHYNLYKLAKHYNLPHTRIGHKFLFEEGKLKTYMKKHSYN